MKELDTKEMDSEEKELHKMLRSKFNNVEMLRLAKLMVIDAEKYHQEKLNNNIALGDVIPRFSVSLVYQNAKETMLRVIITNAENEDEALGKALNHFDGEVKDMGLMMKTIIKLNEV